MALTVAQILALDVFQRARPEVIVGGKGMEEPVRWVHISDYPDIAASLRGGELLLTSGLRLRDDPEAQERYVSELAGARVVAIVLEAGESFVEVPAALRSAAERRGLPLILLRTPAPYVDITQRVHTALINSHYQALDAAQRISEDLTRLALAGANLRQIVQRLANALKNPVFLEDAAHHLIEYATYGKSVEDLAADWPAHSRIGHDPTVTNGSGIGDQLCTWTEITVRDQVWGRLHVVDVDTRFDDVTPLIVDRGGGTLGMTMLAERESADWLERARESLIDDIIHGSYISDSEFLSRTRGLGARLDSGELVALAAQFGRPLAVPNAAQTTRDAAALLASVRASLTASKGTGVHASRGDRVLLIAAPSASSTISAREFARGLAAGIIERAKEVVSDRPVLIGACTDVNVGAIKQAIDRAELALRHRLVTNADSGLADFGELGFQRLFLQLSEGPDIALLVEAELGPVLGHDAIHHSDLVETLRIVLSAASIASAARALHIERRSVYHRLGKIRELIACDLDDPGTRTRLLMAVEAQHYLQLRERASG